MNPSSASACRRINVGPVGKHRTLSITTLSHSADVGASVPPDHVGGAPTASPGTTPTRSPRKKCSWFGGLCRNACAETEPEQSSRTTRPVWGHNETWKERRFRLLMRTRHGHLQEQKHSEAG